MDGLSPYHAGLDCFAKTVMLAILVSLSLCVRVLISCTERDHIVHSGEEVSGEGVFGLSCLCS